MELSFYLAGDLSTNARPFRLHMFFSLMVFLERKSCITGVPFGRTDLSIGGIGTTFQAISHRHGPVGPSFHGMFEKMYFHRFFCC